MTAVVFRQYRNGDVIALFPYEPEDLYNPSLCSCYMHIGQHGTADYSIVVQQTKLANLEEAADLAVELTKLGYELRPIKRRQWKSLERARKDFIEFYRKEQPL